MSAQPISRTNNTRTIARNSMWYGLEIFFSLFAALLTSILVARVIGPVRLGYFQYVVWLTNITAAVGSFGLPMTARKYMAEYLNRGEGPVAHAIYRTGLRLQVAIAALLTGAGLALVFWMGDPQQRLISVALVLNMAPRMILWIPSQANNAAELMKRSTPPALIGAALNVGLTLLSIWAGWGLPGVACAFLAGSTVEMALKLWDVRRRLAPVPVGVLAPELKTRMLSYSGQGLVLMLLNVVVWDRSDLVILKSVNPDITQVTFFSLAFNLTERALMIPNAFATSLSATMMAQYGRGEERLGRLTVAGAKYAMLMGLPLLVGMACLSGPAVLLLYGRAYEPLFPVLAIAAVMAIPKALNSAPTALLQTTENQSFLVWTGIFCGALDIGLDFLLTPGYGARGAALANGLAQTAAAIAIWARARRLFQLDLRLGEFGRLAAAAMIMAAVTLLARKLVGGYPGILLAIGAGAVAWFASLRLTGAVAGEDTQRLQVIGNALPARARAGFVRVVGWISVAQPAKTASGAH